MAGTIVPPRRKANAGPRTDMTPIVGGSVLTPDTDALDAVYRLKNGANVGPTAKVKQDLRPGRDLGIGGEGLSRAHGAQDRDPRVDRAEGLGAPADEGED